MAAPSDPPIMVVEDSPAHYEAVARAFRRAGSRDRLVHCRDGAEALDYLFRRGHYADPARSPRPELVLLDLNLPGIDGHEVLESIKGDARLREIPVVILTTSADDRDVDKCYRAGANSFVRKPRCLESFVESVREVQRYWLDLAETPGRR